jgi:putative tryptophan/tyrosine transport system substrate-binding protein
MSVEHGAESKERRTILMMKKFFRLTLCAMLFALCSPAQAQQPKIAPRIGFLMPGSHATYAVRIEAFQNGLRELGHFEGQNIAVEWRFADGKRDRYARLADDLVRLKVDVIVTSTTPVAEAVLRASRTIPIVMAASADPVGTGLVASLARPGGTVTGMSMLGPDSDGKALEVLQETLPKVTRVAFLWDPDNAGMASRLKNLEAVGQVLRLQIQSLEVRGSADVDKALELAIKNRAGTLFVPAGLASVYRKRIIEFAEKKRLPTMFNDSESAEAGGLMSYGVSLPALFHRAATYVDKILKGANPADLPVEQPTKFELLINLKTAKQIGLIIPPNVLARADRVIR